MARLKALEALAEELRRTIGELETLVAEQRQRLAQAEAALEAEKAKPPEVGDFARSTLTNFYGRITRVTPRPDGRAWVEINPYLTPTLPGRSTLDLFDAWELIDDPAEAVEAEEATSVEIVSELTRNLAAFHPTQPPLLSAPDADRILPLLESPAPPRPRTSAADEATAPS
jgi:hypothetical protein